jgi:hypothetical protein
MSVSRCYWSCVNFPCYNDPIDLIILFVFRWHNLDSTKALNYCEKALILQGQDRNLVSLANKARIHLFM